MCYTISGGSMKKVLALILIILLLGVGGYFLYPKLFQETVYYDLYVKSNTNEVSLLDSEYKEVGKIISNKNNLEIL